MINYLFILFAIIAGLSQPIQSGVNYELRNQVHSAYLSGAISNFIGAVIMVVVALFIEKNTSLGSLHNVSWWSLSGGIFSVIIVSSMIIVPTKISYSYFFTIFIAGQLIMATIIDYFGWFGNEPVLLNTPRIVGIILVVTGVFLMKR
ncbi:DMT family transporter [Ligilactobacillus sp. WILCCON 0076]|uniref:DMT family transporter n=1 Tax=Ligilactobacillus ubinensis TaxID=2876789 RepID=A0A9X2FKR3_9LACO|nr:DMT family transporter [Ligilactobacillus ubinensis]MCP0887497.1 DMT family transporter [Ligilactobacillus ubinensis]